MDMQQQKPTNPTKKLWFVRKPYGRGWTPSTWEGGLAIVVYVAGMIALFWNIDETSNVASLVIILGVFIPAIILTAGLIGLCYLKGETPKWQWGNKK